MCDARACNTCNEQMSPSHVAAIEEYETERLRARQVEGWLPLHPFAPTVRVVAVRMLSLPLLPFPGRIPKGPTLAGSLSS